VHEDAVSRLITCATHGQNEWGGHVICAESARGCGAVYQTSDPAAPRYAPKKCPCGRRLMAEGSSGFVKSFTARAICSQCYFALWPIHRKDNS
jgi:hypothetical protein